MYKFKIDNIVVNTLQGEKTITPKPINVIIGPNNAGKSRFLKEIREYLSGKNDNFSIIKSISYEYPSNFQSLEDSYKVSNKMVKNAYGNWVLRAYSNKAREDLSMDMNFEDYNSRGFNSFPNNWKSYFDEIVLRKDPEEFFGQFGALFFQYVGTEERLLISKTQRNYGLDSDSVNYLSAYKYDPSIKLLEKNVKEIFKKDIYLDALTLGQRLTFRVGEDFSYVRDRNEKELTKETVSRLFSENKLDEQGDGLKSYVSTFLSLNNQDTDILILDEPEAFLHPPLARQMGELIGASQSNNKQIFIATHSVEVLKGILTKSQDINIIRITQPEVCKNRIQILDDTLLRKIIETPLLRVSRVMEGLFCEKVVITEAEADELVYQELIEKLFSQSGLYFAHGQNKQTLVEIAKLYKEIGIEYEIIADFDVLRDSSDFYNFLLLMPIDEKERQKIKGYADNIRNLINSSVDIEGLSEDDAKNVQKKKRDTVYHTQGINFFSNDIQNKIKSTLEQLSQNHLHILESGELETLLKPYGLPYNNDKKVWITNAIDKIGNLNANDIKEDSYIYKFLEHIMN